MRKLFCILVVLASAAIVSGTSTTLAAETHRMGIVIMHGKGGSPTRYVSDLARALESRGYLVANLEMPWSGRRDYDVDVSYAEEEVESALATLRSKGAKKVFVAGHSQGGLFALHFAGKHTVDGIIAIASGGSVNSPLFREKLGESLARARQLIADGKGSEKVRLNDFESSKGIYPVIVTPSNYLIWFDPDGAMNMVRAVRAVNPAIPVLWIAPTGDYPQLRKSAHPMFGDLPANAFHKRVEPESDHLDAPTASIEEIVRWTTTVANARER